MTKPLQGFVKIGALFLVLVLLSRLAAAAAPGAPDPHPRLQVGQRGNSVAVLQTVLKEVGFDPGPVDGVFGPLTEKAVRELQKTARLPADGIATSAVWEAVIDQRQIRAGVWQVRSGESLWIIADRANVALQDLIDWNNLANPRLIYAGQKIALRAPGQGQPPRQPVTATPAAPTKTSTPPKVATADQETVPADGEPADGDVAVPAMASAHSPMNKVLRVALTFDDGPTAQTAAVIKTLAEFGVPATFFMVGEKVAAYPAIARMVAAAGYGVGSHGYKHEMLTGLAEAEIVTDIAKAQGVVLAVTGVRPTAFRPPGGASDASVRAALGRFGLATVYWSNTFGDSKDDQSKIVTGLMESIHDGAILMFHETNAAEVAALPAFLETARKAGVKFVGLNDLSDDIR